MLDSVKQDHRERRRSEDTGEIKAGVAVGAFAFEILIFVILDTTTLEHRIFRSFCFFFFHDFMR